MKYYILNKLFGIQYCYKSTVLKINILYTLESSSRLTKELIIIEIFNINYFWIYFNFFINLHNYYYF